MAKKSKEIKFTQDELTNIESIRDGFNEVQTLLGRLEIQRIQTEQALENIHNDKLRLETRYSDLVDEERKVVSDLQEKIIEFKNSLKEIQSKLKALERNNNSNLIKYFESNFTDVKGVNVLMHRIDNLNLSSLRSNLDELKNKIKRCLIIIIGENNQKSQVIVSVSKDIEQTFSAKAIMDLISSKTNLKGGGKNDFAQAGGDAIDNLESIYDLVTTYLENS